MPFEIGKIYDIPRIGLVRIGAGTANGKKYKATRISDGRVIQFGASGARIVPNSEKGNSYCSRSMDIDQEFGFNANTLSRLNWHCVGSVSKKDLQIKPKK